MYCLVSSVVVVGDEDHQFTSAMGIVLTALRLLPVACVTFFSCKWVVTQVPASPESECLERVLRLQEVQARRLCPVTRVPSGVFVNQVPD